MPNPINETGAEKLVLANVTNTGDLEWMHALKETSHLWSEQTLSRFSDVQLTLEEQPRTFVLLAYTSPPEEIAQALARGRAPSEVLVTWQEFAERLINLHQGHPSQLFPVEAQNGPASIHRLADRIRQHTGQDLHDLDLLTKLPRAPKTALEPSVEHHVAARLLLTMRRAKHLAAQLATITLSVDTEPLTSDLIELFLNHSTATAQTAKEAANHLGDQEEQARSLNALKQENSLIIAQLHKSQEELERYVGSDKNLQRKQQWLRGQLERKAKETADMQKTLETYSSEIKRLKQKITWLRTVKDQHRQTARNLRERVRQQNTEIHRHDHELGELSSRLKRAEEEARALRNSRSWRYTQIIRNIKWR